MIEIRLQGTKLIYKNQLFFYAINRQQSLKLKLHTIYISSTTNEIHGYKSNNIMYKI